MLRMSSAFVSGCLLALAASSAVAATTDRSFSATGRSCSDVQWSQAALAQYPSIASACQEVVERNGRKYVKVAGTIRSNRDRGQRVTVRFVGGDTLTLTPPAGTSLYVDGRRTPVASLRRGDNIHVYVPEDQLVVHHDVEAPVTIEHAPATQMEIAEAEEPEPALPKTASARPSTALAGVLLLALGGALALVRVRQRRA